MVSYFSTKMCVLRWDEIGNLIEVRYFSILVMFKLMYCQSLAFGPLHWKIMYGRHIFTY